MSFFPRGITRIGLLTILFPLFSITLCAWMTVFGFYLRLEDKEKRLQKKKKARLDMERSIKTFDWEDQYRVSLEMLDFDSKQVGHQGSFVNLAYQEFSRSLEI